MKFQDAIFYHIYPLGALGVLDAPREPRPGPGPIARIADWIPALERVGANALLLGPVFESERHGYDTTDLLSVDRRLGSNQDLSQLARQLGQRGISLVLDAVFNHVGRSHPIVRDVVEKGAGSAHARWISGFDPSRGGPGGLPFSYEGWAGNYDLVKLDTGNPEVREHLIGAALRWIEEFGISGLRLDAANCLDCGFLDELGRRCRAQVPDFFLFGEAVHGDQYRSLLEAGLDSVTNFEACKGLWSSINDRNFFEIGWTLERLFGENGLCKGKALYSFADNHDVDRVASLLRDPAGLYPLYGLLFSMPGVPSIYYGSEFGIQGRRREGDDSPLRAALDPQELARTAPHPDLARAIGRFAQARRDCRAVREGGYRALETKMEGISFLRQAQGDLAVVAVGAGETEMTFHVQVPEASGRTFRDLLDPSCRIAFDGRGKATVAVPPRWLRWLVSA
jgi:glycosidase